MTEVSLDLDALAADAAPEPFSVRLGGETFTFTAFADLDYRDQMAMARNQDVDAYLRAALGEQYDAFSAHSLPAWKLEKLVEAHLKASGVSRGELPASPTS